MKFGDENTKLFQSIATQTFRRNYISHLYLEDCTCLTDHDQKTGALWNYYKDRLGISEYTGMLFDLSSLTQEVNMPGIDEPFSKEEIDAVIKEMPSDKAPGPDGFNAFFHGKMLASHCSRLL